MVLRTHKNEIRDMLKQFFPLLLAIGLQQLLALTVNLVDNFMLGSYAESAMSGASVVNQVQFVLQQLIVGIGAGMSVLGAQYWGKQEIGPIKKIIAVGIKTSFVIGAVFSIVTAVIPEQIVALFTNDRIIIEQGTEYLSIMCITYVIFSISATLMISMQSIQSAFIGTIMSGSTLVINFCLNYILIFGNFGAPELGVKGAAYATLISRSVELIIILIYVLFIDKKIHLKLIDMLRFKTGFFKDYVLVAAPVFASGALWGVAMALQTAILGHLGAEVVGANSIAGVIFQLFAVFGFACAQSSSVIMGKTVGMNARELIRPFSITMQLIFLGIGLVSGALMFIFREPIVGLYAVSPETKDLAITFLAILSITSVGSIYEFPVMSGIIGGGGDPKYQAIMDMVFMWCFILPLSFCSAYVFHWGPVITFICLKIDQLLKCIPNAIYCNSYKWVKNRTREEETENETT